MTTEPVIVLRKLAALRDHVARLHRRRPISSELPAGVEAFEDFAQAVGVHLGKK